MPRLVEMDRHVSPFEQIFMSEGNRASRAVPSQLKGR
jgi:hypothetical protein